MEENKFDTEVETPKENEISVLKEDSYVCTECKSPIEILSIDEEENKICFRCLKNKSHEIKTLPILEYLEKMKKNTYLYYTCSNCNLSQNDCDLIFDYCFECNNILCNQCKIKHIPNDHHFIKSKEINTKCLLHKGDVIIGYCLDCNIQLCNKCLDSRKHFSHRKNMIREIKPKEIEINIVKKMIDKFSQDKCNLENEEKKFSKKFEDELTLPSRNI